MIEHKKPKVLWHQSEARTTPAVWNWSVKTLSSGALLVVLDFSPHEFFSCPFRLFPAPTNCPWVSEDESDWDPLVQPSVALETFLEEVKFELANIELNRPKGNLSQGMRNAVKEL